jgi:hypothetical protein
MKKPKPIAERDLRRNRCYSRDISKDMLLQIYDRPSSGPGHVRAVQRSILSLECNSD